MLNSITTKNFSISFFICVVFYIWHSTLPALGYYTPAVIFVICVLFLYAYIFARIRNFNNMSRIYISLLSLYFLGIFYSGTSHIVIKLYQILQVGLYPLLIFYIAKYCNKKFIKYLFWAIVCSYVVTAITTYVGCILYPGAARMLALPEEEMGTEIFVMYKKANIGNLTFTYSLVLLFPQIIYLVKSKIVGRVTSLSMLCILTICILETEYTTALLLMVMCFLLFFLPVQIKQKHIFPLFIVFVVVFLISWFFIGDLLVWLSSSINSETMAVRLNELGTMFSNSTNYSEDGDVGSRIELYSKSVNSFFSNPLWGGSKEVGGHSLFFDSLARYGLLGLAAFYLTYRKSWEYFYKPFKYAPYYGYMLFSFILVIVMAVLNPKDNLGVLTFTIPLFALYYKQKYESTLDR